MHPKRIYRCLIFLLPLLLFASYAQASLYKLPVGKTELGFAFSAAERTRTIGATFDYGIDNYLKMSFLAGVGFDDNDGTSLKVPPYPTGGISMTRIDALGQTGLEYFMVGSFSASFSRLVDNSANETLFGIISSSSNETLIRTRVLGLSGGGGILKRLNTQSEWVLKPFLGLYYANFWTVVDFGERGFEDASSTANILGEVGLEIEMSPKTSVKGSLAFSFESSLTVFSIGINFH